jgi:hypothetical protein
LNHTKLVPELPLDFQSLLIETQGEFRVTLSPLHASHAGQDIREGTPISGLLAQLRGFAELLERGVKISVVEEVISHVLQDAREQDLIARLFRKRVSFLL